MSQSSNDSNEPRGDHDSSESSRIDDAIEHSQKIIDKWETYIEAQQVKRAQAAAQLQEIMDISGLSAKGIDYTDPAFAQIAEDLEFRRQVSLHFGLKLDKAGPIDTSKPDVSRWRQRTSALKV